MKILYIAQERPAALVAAQVLRRIAPDARLTWAPGPAAALGWIRDNRDADAVIVDAGIENPGSYALLGQIRALGLDTGVMVVALEQLQAMSAALDASVARQEARHDAVLARTTRVSCALQERLLELEGAMHVADERLAAQSAATADLTRREAQLSAALAEAVAVRSAIERQLADAEAARADVVQNAAKELAGADERYARLDRRLDRETTLRAQLEKRLAAAGLALDEANRRHAAELESRTRALSDRDAQEVSLKRVNRICIVLQEGLLELEAAMRTAGERQDADTDSIERLTGRVAELTAAAEQAVAARTASERQLSEAENKYQRAASELTGAAGRCAALEQQLEQRATTSAILEQRLASAQAARQETAHRHAAELAALASQVADLQTKWHAAASLNAELEGELQNRSAALEEARRKRESDVAALTGQLTRHETEARAAVAEAVAARSDVESRLSEAERALQHAVRRADADREAASARYAAIEQRLGEESAERTSVEAQLATVQGDSQEAAARYSSELAAVSARFADVQAQHDEAVSERAALADQLRQEIRTRISLDARLTDADTALNVAEQQHATEVSALNARLADLEARHVEALAGGVALKQQLTMSAAAFEQAQRDWQADVTSAAASFALREAELTGAVKDATAARAALEARLAEAEAAYRAADQRARNDRAAAAERHASLEAQLELRAGEIASLQRDADALRPQLEALRTRADALRRHGKQVGMLQLQLEKSQKDNRRQFERAPYGLWECGRDGSVIRINHSLARLLGYGTSADVQANDFVATVFESAADLRWLLERALQTGTMASVDTTLKTRDLRRVSVRLHAHTRDESVVIAVEDVTRLQEVEQRLREAERLEAVGRVASEVAETCDTLLRDVSQGGRQWLAGFESDTRLRQQGEQLLGDVTRAAGFLRQFVAYGHQQISNGSSVNLPHVLRDMAPILKRVLGDDVTLVLPKTVERFEIDVDAERVERIFVNVANCARERMPKGGRVKIQLATTVVDQQFLASHPRVRPGAHVVITITEIRGAIWPALPVRRPSNRAAFVGVPRTASERPGMDLGPLLAIIGDAGGHLWMSAEAEGNVTLQIHLPQRPQAEVMATAVTGAAANRGRQLARWFRH